MNNAGNSENLLNWKMPKSKKLPSIVFIYRIVGTGTLELLPQFYLNLISLVLFLTKSL